MHTHEHIHADMLPVFLLLFNLRTWQVRCRTGTPFNNGRPLRISDLVYGRAYNITDNSGRYWPGGQQLLLA